MVAEIFTFGFDPGTVAGFLALWLALFAIIGGRYLVVAGFFYGWFWVWQERREHWRKIWPGVPSRRILRNEILWSIATSGIFALSGVGLGLAATHGWLQVYPDLDHYGLWYLPVSLALLLFFHETYFYFIHRAMHASPFLMRHVHAVHHYSVNPSPWAGFSFHPSEGVLQALIIPALLFVVPTHPLVLLVFLVVMTVTGITNHLGYEIYWPGFARGRLTGFIINATHHSLHHKQFDCNYGLYFTFWDRLLGTENPAYPDFYDAIQARRPGAGPIKSS